ncbi:MAG: isoprenylcysteine carboxylmethyltransferase family protein [candidate division Zixibacteria bacterium]|nr:isoprenylcysteine carboxylmethyltransferase family protein [candidate division Zixibacteria bacterium]
MKMRKPLPPTYFITSLILTAALHLFLPVIQLIHSPYRYGGIILIIFGIWINLRTDNLFKRYNTTVKPFENSSAMITEGPFRFTRNPMYLGMVFILLGASIVLGSLTTFIIPAAYYISVSIVFIPDEEKTLEDVFGNEYLKYKKHVRRWL